jgi:hypothetical protein
LSFRCCRQFAKSVILSYAISGRDDLRRMSCSASGKRANEAPGPQRSSSSAVALSAGEPHCVFVVHRCAFAHAFRQQLFAEALAERSYQRLVRVAFRVLA